MQRKHCIPCPRGVAGAILSLFMCIGPATQADNEGLSAAEEYELKAVFVYNLLNFVNWPASVFSDDNAPFQVCVIGKNPFAGALELIAREQQAAGRKLSLRYPGNPGESTDCHLIFFTRSEQSGLTGLLSRLPATGVLMVSDIPGFVEQGGMVEFYVRDQRVRLRIDHSRVSNSGLKANAQLLRLADVINPAE